MNKERGKRPGRALCSCHGHVFDAFNGFPGPLPSQGSCHAQAGTFWVSKGKSALTYFNKRLISKARLAHWEGPKT